MPLAHPPLDPTGRPGPGPGLSAWGPFLAVAAFLVAATGLATQSAHGVYNGQRLWETWTLLAAFCAIAVSPPLRQALARLARRIPRWIIASVGLALLIGTLSALRFPHPGYGLAEPAMIALLLMLALGMAASRQVLGTAFDRAAMTLVAAIGLVVAVQEAMGFAANWALDREFSFDQMLIQFSHPRFYNQLQSWSLPLLAGLPLLWGRSRKAAALAIALLALQWCILLVSGGRGTFVSVLAALVLVSLLAHRPARQWLSIHIAGFLLGWALFGGIVASQPVLAPEGGALLEESVQRPMAHTSGRFHLWRMALDQAMADPWLGSGPGRYSCHVPDYSAAHPHNFVLQLLAEWGLPAALLIVLPALALGLGLLYRVYRTARFAGADQAAFLSLMAASVCAAALHANLSGVLMTPASQVLGALIVGWVIALGPAAPAAPRSADRRLPAAGLAAAVAAALALALFALVESGRMDTRVSEMTSAHPDVPRFWQSGRICAYSYPKTETW